MSYRSPLMAVVRLSADDELGETRRRLHTWLRGEKNSAGNLHNEGRCGGLYFHHRLSQRS